MGSRTVNHEQAKKNKNQEKPRKPTSQPENDGQLPHSQVVDLQRVVGNRNAQRLIADGKVARPRKKKSVQRTTLPPLHGVSQINQHGQQTTETATEYEREVPQPILENLWMDQNAPHDPPSENGVKQHPIQRQPQISAVSGEAPVQRGFFGSVWKGVKSVGSGILKAGKAVVSAGAGVLKKGAELAFKAALKAAGVSSKLVMGFLKKAGSAFLNIITNPVGFLKNLIGGISQGFKGFLTNIGKHLKGGLLSWLFGALAGAGIEMPSKFDMKSILGLVLQILGVTANAMKMRLAKLIGQKNMERIEKAYAFLKNLIGGGLGGLWKMLKNTVGNLKQMVIGEIRNWVITRIIQGAVLKILSMFNPASALVSIIQTIYKIIQFFIERGSQIMELFKAIAGSVAAIVAGNVSALAQKIESVLARAIPVVIGFLASLLGLGGIAGKIKSIIQKVRAPIEKGINAILTRIVKAVKKLLPGKKAKTSTQEDPAKRKKIQAGIAAINQEEKQYLTNGKIKKEEAQKVATAVKGKHPVFAKISVVDGGKKWNYQYIARETIEGEEKEEGRAENYAEIEPLLGQQVDDEPPPKLPASIYHYRKDEADVIIAIVRNPGKADDAKYQALGVDDDGKIVVGERTRKRISNPSKMKREMPPEANHQTHHIIPDNVARKHPLVVAARERGQPTYDIDDRANLINLPSTYQEWEKKGRGERKAMHMGSHPKWDAEAMTVLTQEQQTLLGKDKYQGKTLDEVTPEDLTNAVKRAETRLRMRLQTWSMVSIGNRKRVEATIKKRLGR